MSNLVILGMNHRTARVDIRQKAAFSPKELPDALNRLTAHADIEEALITSTCNRVEILSRVKEGTRGIEALQSFLGEKTGLPADELTPVLYRHTGTRAVRHLFRQASSLDSMILGESQILGQIKSFYGVALGSASVGPYLNALLPAAFHTAKRVRSETAIGDYSVSVSSAAVELARKVFGDLDGRRILVVGAGKMGELALRYMKSFGAALTITNRSSEAARSLAQEFGGATIPFEDLTHSLGGFDIVITSTGSQEILIDSRAARSALRKRKNEPIILIDISVPRNVDPKVGDLENVFCYDIDDLTAVVEANLEERRKAAAAAEIIVEQEVEEFEKRMRSQDLGPVVAQLQDRIREICRLELERFMKRAGARTEKETRELESMVYRISNKIAHPIVVQLKSAHHDPQNREAYLDTIKRIFKL